MAIPQNPNETAAPRMEEYQIALSDHFHKKYGRG